jgi:hypothetical protein
MTFLGHPPLKRFSRKEIQQAFQKIQEYARILEENQPTGTGIPTFYLDTSTHRWKRL